MVRANLLTGRVGDGGMEAAEVDEGVGAEEEVGNDGSDGVELSFKNPGRKGQLVGLHPEAAWHPSP